MTLYLILYDMKCGAKFKYSYFPGMTYGDQSNSTVLRKDVESMPLTSLLDLFQQATGENFTFGADKLYLKLVLGLALSLHFQMVLSRLF